MHIKSIYIFLIISSIFSVNADEYHFNSIGLEQGLSQDLTIDLFQDEFSRIWIATSNGINCFDGNVIRSYRINNIGNKTITDFNVKRMAGDKKGNLYLRTISQILLFDLATESVSVIWDRPSETMCIGDSGLWFIANKKLYQYNLASKIAAPKFVSHKIDLSSRKMICSSTGSLLMANQTKGFTIISTDGYVQHIPTESEVLSFLEDSNRNIWIGTKSNGIFCFSTYLSSFTNHIEPKFDEIRTLCLDFENNLWFGSRKGLGMYNFSSNKYNYFSPNDKTSDPISFTSINSLFTDKYGTIWIGTYLGGINYLNFKQQNYKYITTENSNLPDGPINNLIEDNFGDIWVGIDGGGLCRLKQNKDDFILFSKTTKEPINSNNIKDLFWDKQREIIWIAGNYTDKLDYINIKTGEIKSRHIYYPSADKNCIEALYGVVPSGNDIYLSTNCGIYNHKIDTEKTVKLETVSKLFDRYNNDLVIDRMKNMWFTYANQVVSYSIVNDAIKYFPVELNGKFLEMGNVFYTDNEGSIWFGTHDFGLFLLDNKTGTFKSFKKYPPLINSNILAIGESFSGDLIVVTSLGIVKWNKIHDTFDYLGYNLNFKLSAIQRRSLCVTKSGEIYLGATKGIFIFDVKRFSNTKKVEKIFFSRLLLNNEEVKIGGADSILNKTLTTVNKIELPYTSDLLSIEYYIDNLISRADNPIEYRLTGYRNEWIENRNSNTITYSNLSPGNYTLEVRLINNPEIINRLNIRIKPPLYRTWWAIAFYLISIISIVWWFIRQIRIRFYLKTSLDFEKREKIQIEEMNQSKIRFFANISHEIKTPITLILGQIDLLLESHRLDTAIINRLQNIYRNSANLKTLVNELLDFRKQELGLLKVKVSETDIVPLFSEFFAMFNEMAISKRINYQLEISSPSILLWIDSNQIHKVINNLLSNAFKYTPEKGQIVLKVIENTNSVTISVEDSGDGIPEVERENIFERYYQINNSNSIGGSGIGLALSKGIIELHGGNIYVTDNTPKGSVFNIEIPKGCEHINPDFLHKDQEKASFVEMKQNETIHLETHEVEETQSLRILVIDDNVEIRNLLKELLETKYIVNLAVDGVEGYNKVAIELPDLVIADVMMPNMSGTDLCVKIKENIDTCHIPVILLTAKSGVENRIEGLNSGADSYISKPFNSKHLLTQIDNLFQSRKQLRDKYLRQVNGVVEDIAVNSMDQDFLRKATKIVEENLDNEDFNVEMFSREMALGRTSLFAKIKGITGETPNNFIQNIRLKKGAHLLRTDFSLNITEISYLLGFSSPRYFNKCFKDLFGVAPANYRREKKITR